MKWWLVETVTVIVERETKSLLICDSHNRRVMRWSGQPEIIIDGQGSIYVSDSEEDEVRRYDRGGDRKGTIVAGGHGKEAMLSPLCTSQTKMIIV